MRKDKCAQMEIMGLVVIVILITLGMLFMIQFALVDDSSKKIFTRKGLATSTMSAVMKTTVESCTSRGSHGLSPSGPLEVGIELLEDCARGNNLASFQYTCNSGAGELNSCDFLDFFIRERLQETLGRWGKNYEFHSRFVGEEEFVIGPLKSNALGCIRDRDRDTSTPHPLSVSGRILESTLYICE